MLEVVVLGVGTVVVTLLMVSIVRHIIEWSVAREFAQWKISYRDFARWYEQDPSHWRIFDKSNVEFSGGGQEVYCYFGFFGLIAYKRFYQNFTHNKAPRKHRQNRAQSRKKIDRLYDLYGYPKK